ncbi:MAG TPA: hypothetical protein PLD43_00415 [Anaerolineae bacterium]|nr:hypothetical protein [Anaerolineae bacterium]
MPDTGSGGTAEVADGNATGPTSGEGEPGEIRLTSAQLTERLNRTKRTAIQELLTELGLEKVTDLKAALQKQRDAEAAAQTETQRLQAQLSEYQRREQTWETQRREQALQIAVQAAAQKVGIVDAEVAMALVRGKIEFDQNGAPQGVEAALTDLAQQKPYLKGAMTSGSPTNPPRGSAAVLTREAIARMSPEEINANWDAVKAAMEKGL